MSHSPLPKAAKGQPDEPLSPNQWKDYKARADLGKIQLTDEQYVDDINMEWLYRPHTVSLLLIILGVIIYLAFCVSHPDDSVHNIRMGVICICSFVLLLGLLVFPSGPFIRPHPVFWRFCFGVGLIYNCILIMLLFQNKADARQSFKLFISDSLGKPLEEKHYANDCSLTWEIISSNIFDVYVISHFVGWMVKTLVLRDPIILWIMSIQWEFIEILFTHMLPNFAECWWDQWLLDVLICNGLGIYVGYKLCGKLQVLEYKWSGLREIPNFWGKVRRIALQVTPHSFDKLNWESTKTIKKFFGVQMIILAFQLEELNAFFLKHLFWLPPANIVNITRLAVWFCVGLPATRQVYGYMTDDSVKRIGNYTLLGISILVTELLVIFKFSRGEFPTPMSDSTVKGAIMCFGAYILLCVVTMVRIHRQHSRSDDEAKKSS